LGKVFFPRDYHLYCILQPFAVPGSGRYAALTVPATHPSLRADAYQAVRESVGEMWVDLLHNGSQEYYRAALPLIG
jgi:hypothetical protein